MIIAASPSRTPEVLSLQCPTPQDSCLFLWPEHAKAATSQVVREAFKRYKNKATEGGLLVP